MGMSASAMLALVSSTTIKAAGAGTITGSTNRGPAAEAIAAKAAPSRNQLASGHRHPFVVGGNRSVAGTIHARAGCRERDQAHAKATGASSNNQGWEKNRRMLGAW